MQIDFDSLKFNLSLIPQIVKNLQTHLIFWLNMKFEII